MSISTDVITTHKLEGAVTASSLWSDKDLSSQTAEANQIPAETARADSQPSLEKQRYLPLDAYRGLIMILLVSEGFGFRQLHGTPFYDWLAHQFDHRPWGGADFWDLIMPAFLFMVGVAMPFSLNRKIQRGETPRRIFLDVCVRCLGLIVLSEILMSIGLDRPHLQFHHVLTQVAITYFLCFFLMKMKFWQQALAAFLLLAGHSALYLLFPGPDGAFAQLTNAGARIDRAIMGFNYHPWPVVNINFIAEIPNVLFGVWAGNLLRSRRPEAEKLKVLALGMVAAFASGLLLSPLVPINKWLWTASYTLYTTGWVLFGMLAMILLVEHAGVRKPMFPLVVVGMNPLFVYCADWLLSGPINQDLRVFTQGFEFIGTFAPVAQSCTVLLVIWLLAFWLYRHKIFIKL